MDDLKYITIPKNLNELAEQIINKHDSIDESIPKRKILKSPISKFHSRFIINEVIKKNIKILNKKDYILLMSSHQPNLFPYSGVLKKIILMEALRIRIEEIYSVPVITFFEILDNAFPDRWVVEAQLPSMNSKEGYLSIKNTEIEKKRHNRLTGYGKYPKSINSYPKVSKEVIESWRSKLGEWCKICLKSIRKHSKIYGYDLFIPEKKIFENIKDFLTIASEAHDRSVKYSEFNAYILSKIVNEIWGYNTLFAFSSDLNCFLRDEAISLCKKEYYDALLYANNLMKIETVKERIVPFWYQCSCGGKVNLIDDLETLSGKCLNCSREFIFRLSSLEDMTFDFSFRSVPFFIVHSLAFKPEMFVGGLGGLKSYYTQSAIVAKKMNVELPVIAIWNPNDSYIGIGQLGALFYFKNNPSKKSAEKLKSILNQKYSILDYAINIGLRQTSHQWISHLLKNGDLNSEAYLKSFFDNSEMTQSFAKEVILDSER